jgi:hypothetical protein
MKKEFVPYELAVKLKDLGFDEPCFGYYVDGELRGINLGIEELGGIEPYYQRFGFHTLNNHDIDNPNKIVVTTPTFSQAFRWLLNRHNLYGIIIPTETMNWTFKTMTVVEDVIEVPPYNHVDANDYSTYEEAELACLEKLIEIVENEKTL